MKPSRIPTILNPVLQDFNHQIIQKMPGQISALYLVGSIALDNFIPQWSDIDFLAVLTRQVTTTEFETLRIIHRHIEQSLREWKLEGMYFLPEDLGRHDHDFNPFLEYHGGNLYWSTHFELSCVTWWILKNRGITFFGPDTQALNFTVEIDDLIKTQKENLNSYWASYTKRPKRILALLSDWGIQWTVLGVLRQFYTLREQQVTSKTAAGMYALTCIPDLWHPIIREAIAIREIQQHSYFHTRIQRAIQAIDFLNYIIGYCNEYFAARYR